MISKITIDNVKSTMDILSVTQEFVTLKKTGSAYVGHSPFTDEKTPSFNVIPTKGIFKCFSSGYGGDCIEFLIKLKGWTFVQSIEWLAQHHGIPVEYEGGAAASISLPEPQIKQVDATPDQPDGEWYFDVKKEFSEFEIKSLLAKQVVNFISKDGKIDIKQAHRVFQRYNLYALNSYTVVKNRKATTITATSDFPIYMFDEGEFKKLYLPLNKGRKKKNNTPYPRFIYYGSKPKDYLYGLNACQKRYNELNPEPTTLDQEIESASDDEKKAEAKIKKIPEIIRCTGGSDGINVAMLGYDVVWPNGETEKLTGNQIKKLQKLTDRIMNLPDIDDTGIREGHQLALENLEVYTIELPQSLKQKVDDKGNPRKDVRDFLHFNNYYAFKELTQTALPYQFWDVSYQKRKDGSFRKVYEVMNKRLYNFLMKNGFHRFKLENEKNGSAWIYRNGNIVKKVNADDISSFVHEFIDSRKLDERLSDTFYRSPQLNESSLQNLKFTEIDFQDFTPYSQFFFFENGVIEVTKDYIKSHRPGEVQRNVWESEVIKHQLPVEKTSPVVQSPHFKIWKDENDEWDIEILKSDNMFLNFLINTSRMFWRKEYEEKMDGKSEEYREKYFKENQFNIAGPHLNELEIYEQKQHLINKIFTLGYLLHRYKDPSKPWAPYGTEYKISNDGESHGGSGKSIYYKSPRNMMNTVIIDGKKSKLMDDQFLWENVNIYTDYVLMDDLDKYIKFESVFSIVTGELTVNAKNTNRYVIDDKDSPKLAMNSNFPPLELHPSHLRRLLFNVFSDFYHEQTEDYNETRKPIDDFGCNFFRDDFPVEQWTNYYNLMFQCCQFYLSTDEKINPPLNNVHKRNLMSVMGDAFLAWADVYFGSAEDKEAQESTNRLNEFVSRPQAFHDFKDETGSNRWSSQKFGKAISAWCRYKGYELNPKEYHNSDGRIVRKFDVPGRDTKKSDECIFIRTHAEKQTTLTFNSDQDPF